MLCVPLAEPWLRVPQPENVIAARNAKLSAANADFSVVFIGGFLLSLVEFSIRTTPAEALRRA